jgi:hypothetical protein
MLIWLPIVAIQIHYRKPDSNIENKSVISFYRSINIMNSSLFHFDQAKLFIIPEKIGNIHTIYHDKTKRIIDRSRP